MRKASSVKEILDTRFDVMPFSGEWKDSIGCPEITGSWIIWGNSGNGKTRFALQLCKYLTGFGKVAYNSLEEGVSESLRKALVETNMMDVSRRFMVLDRESIPDLIIRLKKRKSPKIICIDSLQYSDLNYSTYKELKEMFPDKLFIYISHADGKNPDGRVAKKVKYDSNVKIFVEGFQAQVTSRYGGGIPYIVWKEGYERFNSEIL